MSDAAFGHRHKRFGRPSSRRALLRASAAALFLASTATPHRRAASAQSPVVPPGSAEPAYAAALRPQLEQLVETLLAPGAAVMVRSPGLGDWSATFGTRRRDGTQPVTLGDHLRIGSNTKPMTGTVILQLVDEGALRLDAPVSTYRPDVPNGDHITITQLLNMRSGLYNYSESLAFNQALDQTPAHVWTPDELLAIAFQQPPYFAPGTGYHYSNTNTILLGLLIEQMTGDSASAAFQKRLFDPLGLTQTVLPPRDSAAIADPHPQGYMYGTNAETAASAVLSAEQQAAAAAGSLQPNDVTDASPSWAWTAGSGISTADDLVQWVQVLVGGGLLSTAMQAQRLASMLPVDPAAPAGIGYGLGLAKLGPMFGHTGEIPGFNSVALYDPAQDLTVVTWASLNAAPDGRPPATTMAQAIIAQLYGPPPNIQAAPE
jgi:D-alanyl-D-alanine carboxypeptidase